MTKRKNAKPVKPVTAPADPADTLTDVQLDRLAQRMLSSGGNIYDVVAGMFDGLKVGDRIFERLKAEAHIFHCEECGRWLPMSERDPAFEVRDACKDCVDAENEDEAEESTPNSESQEQER